MLRRQLTVSLAGALGCALIFAVWHWSPITPLFAELPADDPTHRLAYAIHWLLVPGLTLLAGVVGAGRRGFYADAIDGTRTPSNRGLEINLRYNQNTVEQTLLAAIAWTGLSLTLPHENLIVIPGMALLFGFGRITFWIGYLLHPLARAFGMTLTAAPTLAAFVWLTLQGL
jgi:MAPEG family